MVNYGNILIPLYIYPSNSTDPAQFAWRPLIDAANAYPNVTFTAVINPFNGPDSVPGGCPNKDYVTAIPQLNAIPNIDVMAYVHTASRLDCGPDANWICPCTQPIENVKQNITTYAQWPSSGCSDWRGNSTVDIHVDSIFVDEAPGNDNGANLTYMSNVADHVRSSGFVGGRLGKVLFNAGSLTDYRYFDLADNIIILENNGTGFINSNVSQLDNNGKYASKSSMIVTSHSSNLDSINQDTDIVLNKNKDGLAALYLTDLSIYSKFPTFWTDFVAAVDKVVTQNIQSCTNNAGWVC